MILFFCFAGQGILQYGKENIHMFKPGSEENESWKQIIAFVIIIDIGW